MIDPDDQRLLALLAAVAALTLVVTVAFMAWWDRPVAFDAPADQTVTVQLPHGETVTLGPGAQLRVPRRTPRTVALAGAATVEAREGKPVTVVTRDAQVDALGGHVLVEASRTGTDVEVADGSAQVAPRDSHGRPVALGPGGRAHVGPDVDRLNDRDGR